MSVMYATPDDLASYLQRDDLDLSTATLNLQIASGLFRARASTAFTPEDVTYQAVGQGFWQLYLPFRPVNSVAEVRIVSSFSGQTTTVVITDYSRIKNVLYRLIGFGTPGMFPPDMVEVDLNWGETVTPDDVRGAVLETAATAYEQPRPGVTAEQIDDYAIRSSATVGGMMLTPNAAMLADLYRGTFAA